MWRVLERSDLSLMIVDARNPLLHFSAALYRDVTQVRMQPLILLLNKSDLVPASAIEAWKEWFALHYPELRAVVPVSSIPEEQTATAEKIMDEILKVSDAIFIPNVFHAE